MHRAVSRPLINTERVWAQIKSLSPGEVAYSEGYDQLASLYHFLNTNSVITSNMNT